MSLSDLEISKFANLSYLNISDRINSMIIDYKDDPEANEPVTMKDLADYYLNTEDGKEKLKLDSLQYQEIINTLKECQSGAYKDFKIVDYKNNNNDGGDGFVGYAIETTPNNVIIASRGSEMGDDVTMVDWIDNIKIAAERDTAQQKVAVEFINDIGAKYDSIYITGHSKGGNNALYSAVTADEAIRAKIEKCITFNAPGFNDEFIEYYQDIIAELNERGVFTEYQGEGDFVSAILNNLSDPKVVKNIKWDNKGLIDDHYVYAMRLNGDMTEFVLSEDGRKAFFPNFVNNLVEALLTNLSDEEVDSIISLAEKILSKDEISAIYSILGSDVSVDTVKTILLHTVVEGYNELIREIAKKTNQWVAAAKGFISDTKKFIVNNIEKAKNYIVDKYNNLKKDVEKIGKDAARAMMCGPIDISVTNIVSSGGSIVIANVIYNAITDKGFVVKIGELEAALRAYKPQLANIDTAIGEIEAAITKLLSAGWIGKAATFFYSIRFIKYNVSLKKARNNLSYQIKYLEAALNTFNERVAEEKRVLAVL